MCDSIFNCTSCNQKSYVSTLTRDRGLACWPNGDYGRTIVMIRWNAVSTEVWINVKYHRGINQCHIASDKIIEVRSNGRKVRSKGTRIQSNGMQVAIRLHFCPECPSTESMQTRQCRMTCKGLLTYLGVEVIVLHTSFRAQFSFLFF